MEKYQRLLSHIDWLQALAEDVERMGSSKFYFSVME